uniref:Uncharacterized protein n=1 Tax=viral metagenome TaxID=1070528 RepID=A0A6C0D5M3_9ZZZZ
MSLLFNPILSNSFIISSYSSHLSDCDWPQILANIVCNINCENEYELI